MRRSACFLAVGLISWACTAEHADASPPGEAAAARQASVAAVAAAESDDPVYLGKPLSTWIEQAQSGPEDAAKTIEALSQALGHEVSAVRVGAADALAAMGPDAAPAVPALVGQLGYPVGWVRVAAMGALAAIGPEAVPALVAAFANDNPAVGLRSGLVLRSIGTDAIEPARKAMAALPAAPRARVAAVIEAIRQDAAAGGSTRATATADDLAAAAAVTPADAGDWPQFHGPRRDNLCPETGLLKRWPADGPKLLWKLEGLGRGFSNVAIAGGKLFTMGDRTAADGTESQFVEAFDLATREELWATRVGPPHTDGPRSTPTVDGGLLYVVGTAGDLACVETATGKVRWRKNFVDDFQGQVATKWKFTESPLVDGEKLVCTPGGREATLVALNKKTGEVIWKSAVPELGEQNYGAGYASMVAGRIAGVRQYVQLLGQGLVGVDAETGKFLWGYNRIANRVANVTSPVIRGDYVFDSTAYRTGSALVKITRHGDRFKAEEVYFTKNLQNHHGGVVLVGDYVYGGHGGNSGQPVCLELATGKIAWKAEAPAKGSAGVLYADGHLIFRYDRGPVALIEATPEAFRLEGLFTPPRDTGPAWTHPVILDGKLYLRHNNLLLCYDVRGS